MKISKNKILITGGASGIGLGLTERFVKENNTVIICGRRESLLEEVSKKYPSVVTRRCDLSKPDEREGLYNWISQKHSDLNVLVNNAGIKDDSLMLWMKDEQWENVMRTNLDGFFYVTRLALDSMLVNRYGRIINIVSLSGLKGLPGQTNYSAAKAGIIGATKALAQEVGRSGVTVNAVAPGFIKTDMTAELDEGELKRMIPVNRFGTAEEVAQAVGFLASAEAGYITGHVLYVNGGLYS